MNQVQLYTPQNSVEEINAFLRLWEKDHIPTNIQVWSYVVSHKVLEIRMQSKISGHNIHITAWMTQYFHGPFNWTDPHFEAVETQEEVPFAIQDIKTNTQIGCYKIGLRTDVEPIYNASRK